MKERPVSREQSPAPPPPAAPWQFRVLIVLIAAGVVGIVLKAAGVF